MFSDDVVDITKDGGERDDAAENPRFCYSDHVAS